MKRVQFDKYPGSSSNHTCTIYSCSTNQKNISQTEVIRPKSFRCVRWGNAAKKLLVITQQLFETFLVEKKSCTIEQELNV